MYMYPTPADVEYVEKPICTCAEQLYLDAEDTFLKWRSRMPFFLVNSRFCTIFLPMYLTRSTLSALVASCVFVYCLEPDQTDSLNLVTI